MKRVLPFLLVLCCCSREKPSEPAKPAPGTQSGPAALALAAAAQREAGVEVAPAELRSLPQVLRSTARLTNDENHTWRVGAITEGRIVAVLANPGDTVRGGQILARMHSHDIHESRAEYRKALARLGEAKSEYDFAERARNRARRLLALKAASQEQVEHSETALRSAQSAVSSAQVEVERTRTHLVEFLGISPEPVDHNDPKHQDEGDYIPVRAPAAGIVLTRNITPGTVVTPANDLFIVSNLSLLWAMAEVAEEHLPKLRVGMPVRIYVQAYGQRAFTGKIAKLGESLDPATRTVKVRVDVPNPDGRLKPEMYASSEIELGSSDAAVFVPEESVQEVRGQASVFVRKTADRFEVRPVRTGRSLNGAVEILSGVSGGEPVAVRGAFILKSEFLKSSMAEE